jgi:hypothetical protein
MLSAREAADFIENDTLSPPKADSQTTDTMWRIAAVLLKHNPRLEPFKLDPAKLANLDIPEVLRLKTSHIELNSLEGDFAIQIEIFETQVGITIPYWYHGREWDEIFAKVSEYLRIIGEVAGYYVLDPQAGVVFDPTKDTLASATSKRPAAHLAGQVTDAMKTLIPKQFPASVTIQYVGTLRPEADVDGAFIPIRNIAKTDSYKVTEVTPELARNIRTRQEILNAMSSLDPVGTAGKPGKVVSVDLGKLKNETRVKGVMVQVQPDVDDLDLLFVDHGDCWLLSGSIRIPLEKFEARGKVLGLLEDLKRGGVELHVKEIWYDARLKRRREWPMGGEEYHTDAAARGENPYYPGLPAFLQEDTGTQTQPEYGKPKPECGSKPTRGNMRASTPRTSKRSMLLVRPTSTSRSMRPTPVVR